jgi:hypothetical protein
MKTIYTAVMARLKDKVPALRWIDLDTGQLEAGDRPPVAFPCALISISIASARDVTDTIQECSARVRVRMAFDQPAKTDSATPAAVLQQSLNPYDVIADVYAALQGFYTANFDSLSRARQDRETSRNGLFVYSLEFITTFTDETATI